MTFSVSPSQPAFGTSTVARTPDSPIKSSMSSTCADSRGNSGKPPGSPPRIQATAVKLAASPMGKDRKRLRSESDAAQGAGAASTQVDQHKSKMLKGDESSSEARSRSGTPSAEAQSTAAAMANAESFDDEQPFHYATVLKVPRATDDANNIVLVDDDIEDFEIELSQYIDDKGETRKIPASEPELPWNRLRLLKTPSEGSWGSDAFPCILPPKELAEQIGCGVGDLRRVFFRENEDTDTTELLILKTKDIGTPLDSGKTLEAVVKKIYTDAVIDEVEFLEHLGMIKKELYHYHMQKDLWQS